MKQQISAVVKAGLPISIFVGYVYCPLSEVWIPEKYVCDGAIQCIEGDDERFDLCKDTFPESATITCLENDRPFYNITIKATPCDGIVECRSGEDENCELKPPGIFYIITTCLVSIIFCIWIYRYRILTVSYTHLTLPTILLV